MPTRLAALMLLLAPACWAAEDHFPQPVRVGDLIGRKLIGPSEAQPLLGRVEGVDRGPAGALALRVHTGGLVPIGGHSVDVPLDQVALLGELVALQHLTEAQLDALPAAGPASPVSADETVKIGLVRPFH